MPMADSDDFVGIWHPLDVGQSTLIHAALSGTGINYYINNQFAVQAGGLGCGLGVGATAMELRVERGRAEEALALVKAILGGKPAP